MRIACVILAHKAPQQLRYLVARLTNEQVQVFIHLDAKANLSTFQEALQGLSYQMIDNRASVDWAGYGTIQATRNAFQQILKESQEHFDYVHVMSAQDIPVKPISEFLDFLSEKNGTEFISCESIWTTWKDAIPRMKNYSLINFKIPGKFRLEKLINSILPDRKFPYPEFELVGRANWFTITFNAVKYLEDFFSQNTTYDKFFRLTWGADELYFSTALFNSPFRNFIEPNLVYVDWTGQKEGHPRILVETDFEKIKKSNQFFARKIDWETSQGLLQKLEEI